MTITATDADGVSIIDATGLNDLAERAISPSGRLLVMPSSFYQDALPAERAMLCVRHGYYLLPTFELVAFLKELIAGRHAIEIGSGNGVLAEALDIRATDNYMQQWPEIRVIYDRAQQAVCEYGWNVERIDGVEAAQKYKPQVIVASWLTHKWRETAPHRKGNQWAPDEQHLLTLCDELIFIGNSSAHKDHSLLRLNHLHYEMPFIYSRAVRGKDFVGCWKVKR